MRHLWRGGGSHCGLTLSCGSARRTGSRSACDSRGMCRPARTQHPPSCYAARCIRSNGTVGQWLNDLKLQGCAQRSIRQDTNLAETLNTAAHHVVAASSARHHASALGALLPLLLLRQFQQLCSGTHRTFVAEGEQPPCEVTHECCGCTLQPTVHMTEHT